MLTGPIIYNWGWGDAKDPLGIQVQWSSRRLGLWKGHHPVQRTIHHPAQWIFHHQGLWTNHHPDR